MTTFYIYEVPGVKNGATKEWEQRCESNFSKYNLQPILIETMTGPDTEDFWQVVGDREWELADLNGYDRGTHYRVARLGLSEMGRKGCWTHVNNFANNKGPKSQRLTNLEIAEEIRSKYLPHKYTAPMLAKEYNLHVSTIKSIVQNIIYLTP